MSVRAAARWLWWVEDVMLWLLFSAVSCLEEILFWLMNAMWFIERIEGWMWWSRNHTLVPLGRHLRLLITANRKNGIVKWDCCVCSTGNQKRMKIRFGLNEITFKGSKGMSCCVWTIVCALYWTLLITICYFAFAFFSHDQPSMCLNNTKQ